MSTWKTILNACVATGGGFLLVGCGISTGGAVAPEPAPTEVLGVSLLPDLDPQTGAVVLPADRFGMTPNDVDLLTTASSVLLSRCAAERDVTFVPAASASDPVYLSELYFGPWTQAQARSFGFTTPMTQADLAANGYVAAAPRDGDSPAGSDSPNADLTDADWEVLDACTAEGSDTEIAAVLGRSPGPWDQELADVDASVLDDERVRDAVADLAECYEAAGMEMGDEDSLLPEGATYGTIDEVQVSLALAVVDCKDDVDFTERVASVHAQLQAPVVARYAEELQEQRERIDAALEVARGLVAADTPDQG